MFGLHKLFHTNSRSAFLNPTILVIHDFHSLRSLFGTAAPVLRHHALSASPFCVSAAVATLRAETAHGAQLEANCGIPSLCVRRVGQEQFHGYLESDDFLINFHEAQGFL